MRFEKYTLRFQCIFWCIFWFPDSQHAPMKLWHVTQKMHPQCFFLMCFWYISNRNEWEVWFGCIFETGHQRCSWGLFNAHHTRSALMWGVPPDLKGSIFIVFLPAKVHQCERGCREFSLRPLWHYVMPRFPRATKEHENYSPINPL